MGEDIGITDAAFASCVRDDTHGDWVAGVQDGMADAGVEGTPTIFVNGELREDLTSATPDDLRAAVEEAVPAG
jgi:protein-disulfide isomerase